MTSRKIEEKGKRVIEVIYIIIKWPRTWILNAVEHALEFFKLLCVGVWLWFNPKISWVKFQLTQIEQSRFLDLPYGNQHGSWNPWFVDDFPISMPNQIGDYPAMFDYRRVNHLWVPPAEHMRSMIIFRNDPRNLTRLPLLTNTMINYINHYQPSLTIIYITTLIIINNDKLHKFGPLGMAIPLPSIKKNTSSS